MIKLKQYLKNSVRLGLLFSLLFSFSSCTLKKPVYKRSEVEERIVGSFKNEDGINAVTRVTKNTLYIYIPLTEKILHVVKSQPPPKRDISFFYVDCVLNKGSFLIQYAAESVPESKQFVENITYNLTEYASQIMNKVYYLLQTALTDSPEHFNFFVIYICDIKNGIEMRLTLQETDLKKFFGQALPMAEFNQRIVRLIRGSKDIVDDYTAEHVDFQDIKIEDFICDLIIQRLLYSRFQSSKINSIQEEILKIFYITVKSYGFNAYEDVEISDVLNDTKDLFFRYKIEEVFEPLIRNEPLKIKPAAPEEENLDTP
jgi:hypothetical protein